MSLKELFSVSLISCLCVTTVKAAETAISLLPINNPAILSSTNFFPFVQNGVTKRISLADMKTFFQTNLSIPVVDTNYVANSNGFGTNAVFSGPFVIQNTNSGLFTNDNINFGGRGEIVMPSADWFGEDENTWGGRIIWDYKGGTRSYPQGSSTSPLGLLGMWQHWGGFNPAIPQGTHMAKLTCANVRIEEAWAATQAADHGIDLGNEDHFGHVTVNYTHLFNGGNLSFNTLGRGHVLNFQTAYTIGSGGYLFSTPGIQAIAGGPGLSYGPGGNTRTLGQLAFFSGAPIPSTAFVSNTWSAYPGFRTALMGTNSWFFDYKTYSDSFEATNQMGAATMRATASYAGSFYATNLLQIGDGATNNVVTKGIDLSSGLQPSFMVGADNNTTIRTSGTDKVANMSLAPRTAGNPSHTIFTDYSNGNFPTLSIGGGLSSLAAHAEIDFYAATGPITTTGSGNLQMSIVDGAVQIYTRFRLTGTVTAAGTTTTQTINKPCGTVNFPAAATTVTVNNNYCTVDSIVTVVIMANDTTALLKNVVPSSGSFVIRLNAATTAETKVGFVVHNPN